MMRKFAGFLIVLGLLAVLGAPAAMAQQQPGPIAVIYSGKAKPGSEAQFEAALKEHFAWHRQQGDRWTWVTWQYASGERLGQYIVRSGNHNWADFDAAADFMARDEADAAQRLAPHIASLGRSFTRALPQISNWAGPEPPPMLALTEFRLKPGTDAEFMAVVGRIHEGLQKGNYAGKYSWAQMVAGEEGGVYVLVSPRANWAAMEPPSPSFFDVLVRVYGPTEAQSLMDRFSKLVKSSRSELLRQRPDLSYIP
jgi:hypothetical protein